MAVVGHELPARGKETQRCSEQMQNVVCMLNVLPGIPTGIADVGGVKGVGGGGGCRSSKSPSV